MCIRDRSETIWNHYETCWQPLQKSCKCVCKLFGLEIWCPRSNSVKMQTIRSTPKTIRKCIPNGLIRIFLQSWCLPTLKNVKVVLFHFVCLPKFLDVKNVLTSIFLSKNFDAKKVWRQKVFDVKNLLTSFYVRTFYVKTFWLQTFIVKTFYVKAVRKRSEAVWK